MTIKNKLELNINGLTLTLHSLDPDLDSAFEELYRTVFEKNAPVHWPAISNAAKTFFSKTTVGPTQHDAFFGNFSILWKALLSTGRESFGESLWQRATDIAVEWEAKNPNATPIHKGQALFFWGINALRRYDLPTAFALLHQAWVEDARTHQTEHPSTPARVLLVLDYQQSNLLISPWVKQLAIYVMARLDCYRQVTGSTLDMDTFRSNFLEQPPDKDTLFMFVYSLAQIHRFTQLPPYALKSVFAGVMQLDAVFNLALVLDVAIGAKHQRQYGFAESIQFLSSTAGGNINYNPETKRLNADAQTNVDQTIEDILDGSRQYANGNPFTQQDQALAISYVLRNRAAHSVVSPNIVWRRFDEVVQAVLDSLFLCVEHLY